MLKKSPIIIIIIIIITIYAFDFPKIRFFARAQSSYNAWGFHVHTTYVVPVDAFCLGNSEGKY